LALKANSTQMTPAKTRIAIRSLIKIHQRILLEGGTFAYSDQYRRFIIKRKMLLKLFNLPTTDQNIRLLFEYPMSQAYDIFKIGDESICRHCAAEMMKQFDFGVRHNSGNAKKYGESWNLGEQVNYVHNTLIDLVEHRDEDRNK